MAGLNEAAFLSSCAICFMAVMADAAVPLSSNGTELDDSIYKTLHHRYGLLIPPTYNLLLAPPSPNVVHLGIEITDVSHVDETDYSLTIELVLFTMWNDSRLTITSSVFDEYELPDRWKNLPHYIVSYIWTPNLDILRLKRSEPSHKELYELTRDNDLRFYAQLEKTLTVGCPLDFTSFPFDKHTCHLELSLGIPKNEAELVYMSLAKHEFQWGRAARMTILEFEVNFEELPAAYHTRNVSHFTGFQPEISFVGLQLELRRKATSYLLNYYLPSGLFVVVSWATFVIPVQAVPGRMGLIVTTFLAMVNIANSAFSNSPVAQGINLIQVWIISCLLFVFFVILEYFCLLYYLRNCKSSPAGSVTPADMRKRGNFDIPDAFLDKPVGQTLSLWIERADKSCLTLAPVLFLLYIIIYSVYVLNIKKADPK